MSTTEFQISDLILFVRLVGRRLVVTFKKKYSVAKMADGEFDLSPLLTLEVENPVAAPATMTSNAQPEVVARPISKRRGKKRSSRACTTCRARKVRCNIVAHGAPCSNCRHDEIDCVLPLSRRQRFVHSLSPQFKTSKLIIIQVRTRKG